MKKSIFSALCLVLLATTTQSAWGAIADGTYTLCTSTADLEANAHYIIASGNSGDVYCISNVSNTNNRKTVSATVSANTISVSSTSTIMTFTLGGSKDSWTFTTDNYAGTAGLLAATSSSKNYLGVVASPGNNGKWKITFSDGVPTLVTTGTYTRNTMQYNYNNGSPIFSCYASANQAAVYLYKLGSTEPTLYLGLFLAAFVAVRACVRRVECLATFHHIIMSKIDFRSVHFAKECFVCFFLFSVHFFCLTKRNERKKSQDCGGCVAKNLSFRCRLNRTRCARTAI